MNKFNKGERAEFISTIRSIDEQARTIDFVVSDTSVDRYDTVVKGWVLDSYVRNPVVLFGHDSGALPIGRAISVNEVNSELVAKLQFAPPEVYEFADQVFRLIKAGYLNAVSAGFIPGDVQFNDAANAFELRNNELLEISVVPLPANRNALKKAVADGGLQLRGWQIADDDDAPITPEEEPTVEARAALEAWCTRSVENAPTDDVPVDDPVQPEPTEAEKAFFAAHLVIRAICRDLGIALPESPEQYPEAASAIVAAARAAGEPPASVELLCPPAVQEGLDKILARLDEVESRLASPASPATPADTGTTRALRSIMERATRLAAEG